MSKFIDETNNIYDRLTVLEVIPKKEGEKGAYKWRCKCSCGTIVEVSGTSLRNGSTKSCGCLRNERMRDKKRLIMEEKLFNKNFSTLEIIDFSHYDNGRSYYNVRCLYCNNIFTAKSNDLLNDSIESCGCVSNKLKGKSHLKSEKNNVYGDLTVISETFNEKKQRWEFLCECTCGNTVSVPGNYLRSRNTKSCGCHKVNQSYEVKNILAELSDNNINYKTEYTFPDLLSDKGFPLRFDIAIFQNQKDNPILIEYNGEQHYKSIDFFGGEEYFNTLKNNDKKKEEYCKNNNITLIKLPYSNSHKANMETIKQKLVKQW